MDTMIIIGFQAITKVLILSSRFALNDFRLIIDVLTTCLSDHLNEHLGQQKAGKYVTS